MSTKNGLFSLASIAVMAFLAIIFSQTFPMSSSWAFWSPNWPTWDPPSFPTFVGVTKTQVQNEAEAFCAKLEPADSTGDSACTQKLDDCANGLKDLIWEKVEDKCIKGSNTAYSCEEKTYQNIKAGAGFLFLFATPDIYKTCLCGNGQKDTKVPFGSGSVDVNEECEIGVGGDTSATCTAQCKKISTSPPSPPTSQACGQEITVNTGSMTASNSPACGKDPGQCGLDGALALANTCPSPSTPVKIVFDSKVFYETSTPPPVQLKAPLKIDPVDSKTAIEIEANPDKRVVIEGDTLTTAFEIVDGTNVKISNFLFKKFNTGPLVHLAAGAKNTDVKNLSTDKGGVVLLKSEAADPSDTNVPVMVVPGSGSGEYVLLAILPNDNEPDAAKLRLCEATDASSGDCLSTPAKLMNFKTRKLVDPAGNPTDGTKIILEMTLSGIDANKNYMAFVKNTNKSVAIANLKTGLAPLYKDSDGDWLRDIDETTYFKTDFGKNDTDSDGLIDLYNVIGIPGQTHAQPSGADIFPAADANGFLPGNFTQQPRSASNNENSADGQSGGCSLVQGASYTSVSGSFIAIWTVFGLGLVRRKRQKAK